MATTIKSRNKSGVQKRIELRGWKLTSTSKGFKAYKGAGKKRIVVTGKTLSDIRFFIRFEKFYKGEL